MHRLFAIALLCATARAADLTPAQQAVVDGAIVYNAAMQAAPPLPADQAGEGWPYGVVLVFEGDKLLGSGSIAHLGKGMLTTASHVVNAPGGASPPGPRTYVAVYYDARGKRATLVAENVAFDDPKRDFALLKAPAPAAEQWHSLKNAALFQPTEEAIPTAESVRLLASSPLGRNTYMLSSRDANRLVRPGGILELLVDRKNSLVPGNSGSIIVSRDGQSVEGILARADGTHGEGPAIRTALGLSAVAKDCRVLFLLYGN